MRSVLPRAVEDLRRLEVEVRRAPDPYTRLLLEQRLAALRARLSPRKGARA
jgi:hypothetical protein